MNTRPPNPAPLTVIVDVRNPATPWHTFTVHATAPSVRLFASDDDR